MQRPDPVASGLDSRAQPAGHTLPDRDPDGPFATELTRPAADGGQRCGGPVGDLGAFLSRRRRRRLTPDAHGHLTSPEVRTVRRGDDRGGGSPPLHHGWEGGTGRGFSGS